MFLLASVLTNWYQSKFYLGIWKEMEQKRIEEKLEKFDQEIAGIRVDLHKLQAIKERLLSLTKSIEKLDIPSEKQLLLKCIQ